MSHPHAQLIHTFYDAFAKGDIETMKACYHPDIEFKDPAFGILKGNEVGYMWQMLLERARGNLTITFGEVAATDAEGSAHWEAVYPFSKTGRKVHNKISASFVFRDEKIYRHTDRFNMWKWAGMALGPIGYLLGFTPIIKNKVRKEALQSLRKFIDKRTPA